MSRVDEEAEGVLCDNGVVSGVFREVTGGKGGVSCNRRR